MTKVEPKNSKFPEDEEKEANMKGLKSIIGHFETLEKSIESHKQLCERIENDMRNTVLRGEVCCSWYIKYP